MDIKQLQNRALEIRKKYKELELRRDGKEWSNERLVEGFSQDVTDLLLAIHSDNDRIPHELADCLWSVLVLAKNYNIDIEKSFLVTMDELDQKVNKQIQEI